jgi:hypothetical protein
LRDFEIFDARFIKEYIKRKLFSNAVMNIKPHLIYKLYSFFFEVTKEEENEVQNDWVNYVLRKYQ